MSDCERYGTRDRVYSNWHRIHSIKRFLGEDTARRITMIDLDGLEYCKDCSEAVGVVEIAQDVGQTFKPAVVTQHLADRLGVPGLLVFYRISRKARVSDGADGELPDIERFRVRIIGGPGMPEIGRREHPLVPAQYACWLKRLHDRCPCHIADDDTQVNAA